MGFTLLLNKMNWIELRELIRTRIPQWQYVLVLMLGSKLSLSGNFTLNALSMNSRQYDEMSSQKCSASLDRFGSTHLTAAFDYPVSIW